MPARKGSCMFKILPDLSALPFEPDVAKGEEEGGLKPRSGTYNWSKQVTDIQEYHKIFSTCFVFITFLASRNMKQKQGNKHKSQSERLLITLKYCGTQIKPSETV